MRMNRNDLDKIYKRAREIQKSRNKELTKEELRALVMRFLSSEYGIRYKNYSPDRIVQLESFKAFKRHFI